jgi:predicted RNase H-like HicB family nuclease
MNEVTIRLHIEPLEEGGYLATSPDVPGLLAQADTVTQATAIAQDVARVIAECCIAHGDPLPPALARSGANATFDVIVPVGID